MDKRLDIKVAGMLTFLFFGSAGGGSDCVVIEQN